MAEFLTTTGVSAELEKIVSGAQREIFIVSPYLKINQRMKDLLADADRLRRDIRVIYGKNELQPSEGQWLQDLREIKTYYRQNLHAKCYLNEQKAIVTSMNLYEFSQINNDEMGILISREADPALYDQVYGEVQRLLRAATSVKLSVTVETIAHDSAPKPIEPVRGGGPKSKPTLIEIFGIKKTDLKPEMIEARRTYPRAYESWTVEEEDAVIELVERRTSIDEIARLLGRQPSAIDRKVKSL
jgi:phosphatidylserine/phosphatidylglycerophosphate/cardiolipin synthase-like enzyme